MSLPSVEIPLGAMRFNSDSSKLEYWNGSAWFQIHTFSPNLDGGVRGIYGTGGVFPAPTNTLEYITISSQGNGTDFGDLTEVRFGAPAPSSSTRACFGGGQVGAPSYAHPNTIDYVTMASTGNAIDFGDQQHGYNGYGRGCMSSGTRGFFYGDRDEASIDYITIASTGNAKDFGDLNEDLGGGPTGGSSQTRGLFCGGYHPSPSLTNRNTIQFITMATTGNTQDFGDMTTVRGHPGVVGNATRILITSGYTPTHIKSTDKVTIATGGNATRFGDTSFIGYAKSGESRPTRGVFLNGSTPVSPNLSNVIEYNELATEGDAVDFGDTGRASAWNHCTSNGHGGLG